MLNENAGLLYHLHSGLSWALLLLLAAGAVAAFLARSKESKSTSASASEGAENAGGGAWRWLGLAGLAAAALMVGSGLVLWFQGSRPASAELSIVHLVLGLGVLAHVIMAVRPGQNTASALRTLATAAALGLGALAIGLAG